VSKQFAGYYGSDWLMQGSAIENFEQSVAEYCGSKYAVAVCNATAALHIAAVAVGLGKGKKIGLLQVLLLRRLTALCIVALRLILSISIEKAII
jgi:hypothetical protein